ncbi:MAG: T9SS type A sorting domain-containing protein [Bacteroidetes bacterium]|nr:MAG: T9SS type A sorting domain-containing protein [Bacteroidota bacterium]
MKKILLTTLLGVLGTFAYGQLMTTNFLFWNDTMPENWGGTKTSIANSNVVKFIHQGGTPPKVAMRLVNEGTSHKRMTTQGLQVNDGVAYDIHIWARGKGDLRTGLWDNNSQSQFGYTNYNSYINIDSAQWGEYTQQIVALNTFDMAEFILSVRSTDSISGHLEIDSVAIVEGTVAPPVDASIYEIQFTADASGDSPMIDKRVRTGGIVSAWKSDGYYIQDNSGAYNGVFVYDTINKPSTGDSLTMVAKVKEYNGLTELTEVDEYMEVSTGNTIHDIVTLPTGSVSTEAYESVMVRVENAQVTGLLSSNRFNSDDGSGDVMVDDFMYQYTVPSVGLYYEYIQGVVDYSFSEFKILPRKASDMGNTSVGVEEGTFDGLSVYPNAVEAVLNVEGAEGAQLSVMGMNGVQVYSVSNAEANQSVDMSGMAQGVYVLRIQKDHSVTNIRVIKK